MGTTGYKHSEETKKKMSENRKGKRVGFRHSEETKAVIAQKKIGMHLGPKSPKFTGKRKCNGYIYIYAPTHPYATKSTHCLGFVFEHRLVAEQMIGRYLTPSECVHHINGIKTDNRPENLVVCQSHGKHAIEYHTTMLGNAIIPKH